MGVDLKRLIGLKVQAARARKKWTQEQVAAAIDRTPESVSNIERGRNLPTLETLSRIAHTLGVPLRDFFDDQGEFRGRNQRRIALELKIRELVRELRDDDLEIALGHVEIIRSRRGPAKHH